MVIVVTGAAVRLTGSGLGCDDWPRCNDQQLVDVSSGHAAIEQVNRLFTGLVALGRDPRRARLAVAPAAPARPHVAVARARRRGASVRSCSAGSRCSSTSTRWPSAATCCCRRRSWPCAVVLLKRAGEPDGPRRPVVTRRVAAPRVGARDGDGRGDRRRHRRHRRRAARRRRGRPALRRAIADAARVHGTLVIIAVALAAVLGDPAAAPGRRPPGAAGRPVVVDLRRPAAGGDRLHPVLQRRPGAARRPPRRRGDGAVGDDGVARAGHRRRRRRQRPVDVAPMPAGTFAP